jgi:glycosyltransferase involved in cell wall biosynthesis
VRLLFVKHSLVWPRSSGHDVHTFHMMKACAELGHDVSLATVVPPEKPAIEGAQLRELIRLDGGSLPDTPLPGTFLQRRFRSFWGIEDDRVMALKLAVDRLKPDAVVVSGLDALPYFPALSGTIRIWYAADEWVLHHLSQLQLSLSSWREHVRDAVIKGLYERAHRHVIDRVWVVSEGDQRAMNRLAGIKHADLLPNGVDSHVFAPGGETVREKSAVFWGRLDFGPNIQALEWFCRRVWPLVRRQVPDGTVTIIGFQPTDHVRAMTGHDGIELRANLRDLRGEARSHAVAVMPFVSGAGIKNKLLEAAAMGIPIVGTAIAGRGLRGKPPFALCTSPETFAEAIVHLWGNRAKREQMGADAREWVVTHHTWTETAREAMAKLEAQLRSKR